MRFARLAAWSSILVVLIASVIAGADARQAAARPPARVDLTYADARPVIETLRDDLLPIELRAQSAAGRAAGWGGWLSRRDREIRARLDRGDEDSIVNLLLFGITF